MVESGRHSMPNITLSVDEETIKKLLKIAVDQKYNDIAVFNPF